MKKEVRDHLISEYDSLMIKEQFTALKYHFSYKNVDVNIYFDNYDGDVPSLSMILAYNKTYYFTSLNINNITKAEYLKGIPEDTLKQLLDENNCLISFFESIESHILSGNKSIINYGKDTCFANTMKYSRPRSNLPFLYSLRKAKMPEKTLKLLSEPTGIDRLVLKKIQSEGFTIVRTDDFSKRKSLIAILDNSSISIK